MDWRVRVSGAVYRLAVVKAGSDKSLQELAKQWLERYAVGSSDRAAETLQTPAGRISRQASEIAGALWDDRQRVGTLGDQLRACANAANAGSDGDLTDEDRTALLELAAEADRLNTGKVAV